MDGARGSGAGVALYRRRGIHYLAPAAAGGSVSAPLRDDRATAPPTRPVDRLSLERLDALLDGARATRVLVVGDVMLDVYLTGTVDRISPEAPVPVVHVREESSAVGGAANVAANVRALGAACGVVGCVGDDAHGRLLRDELEALGIDISGLVADGSRPTTVKTRVLAKRQQVVRYDREREEDLDAAAADDLVDAVGRLTADADVVVMEDYNKGVLVPGVIDAVLSAARERGLPSVVDPKRRRFFDFAGVTVFKPNAKELEEALHARLRPDDPEWIEATRERLGCEHLLVTLGEEGMVLGSGNGSYVRVPTAARSVYDVSGAGDTVVATVAVALAAGADIEEAAVMANHAAGVEVGKAGVATVSPDELRTWLREHPDG